MLSRLSYGQDHSGTNTARYILNLVCQAPKLRAIFLSGIFSFSVWVEIVEWSDRFPSRCFITRRTTVVLGMMLSTAHCPGYHSLHTAKSSVESHSSAVRSMKKSTGDPK